MSCMRATLEQLAGSDVPVVFQGETGAGKEVLARELHALSARASRPFLKINCAAVPLELLESELFGYERGAFTGALATKPGKFELADGGSILLDEVGDMDIKLQAKLLHVLQDNEFQRLGGIDTIKVDVRVLTATHRDLRREIGAGRFREDLYYRLNVVTVSVPPLRERKDEIPSLARFFLEKHGGNGGRAPALDPELERALLAYGWPGNIRELENVVRRLLVFPDPAPLLSELRLKAADGRGSGHKAEKIKDGLGLPGPNGHVPTLTQVEEARTKAEADAIAAALARVHWNRRKAAALLDVDYKSLLYKMRKLGLDGSGAAAPPEERADD
ncbi:MAG TPA: sigma-54 dependent transcriptional regulator [Bryobacteraceae bacterium]|nr:sigma-54 dependent transcriptional regulator [Bryobacteraceae bacterium]